MTANLPASILTGLLALGSRIVEWCESHPDAPLAEQEWGVLSAMRASLPGLLEAALLQTSTHLREPALSARQFCPSCGKGRRPLNRRLRTLLTVCGPVTITRGYY